jgi:8-oxo-dGTP pyrophosphatase MutT (NUDIX family)
MHRQQLLNLLYRYRPDFMEEAAYVRRARAYVEAHPDCFERTLLPAHVTGSAWVVSPDRERVLLLHHRKHDQWFQPGGHADGDADILRVALRETQEETGLDPQHIRLVSEALFDVDIHGIANVDYAAPHDHIDIRFLVEIDDSLPVPGNDESHDILWAGLTEVTRFNNNRSTWRMLEKTRRMRNLVTARA